MQEYTRPGGNNLDQALNGSDPNSDGDELITLLRRLLDRYDLSDGIEEEAASAEEFAEILAILRGKPLDSSSIETPTIEPEEELTPVNRALGTRIGRLLNGRKTGIGIIGLLATTVLPTLFPQASPIVDLLRAIGIGPEAASASGQGEAPNILTPIFGALTGWGVLGKIDKWVAKIKKSNSNPINLT